MIWGSIQVYIGSDRCLNIRNFLIRPKRSKEWTANICFLDLLNESKKSDFSLFRRIISSYPNLTADTGSKDPISDLTLQAIVPRKRVMNSQSPQFPCLSYNISWFYLISFNLGMFLLGMAN